MTNSKNSTSFQLQFAQAWIDDPAGKDAGVKIKDFDLSRFCIDFYLTGDRPLVPVDRADALSGFQIQAAAGAESPAPDEVALVAAQHDLTVAQRTAGRSPDCNSTLSYAQITPGGLKEFCRML